MTKIQTMPLVSRRDTMKIVAGAAIASTTGIAGASAKNANGTEFALTQVRNATLRIDYAGVRFLVDPMFAPKSAAPGFPGSANSQLRNPLVDLPLPFDTLTDVDAVIVTHLHTDHWDETAQTRLNKDLPIFAQNDQDAAVISSQGFTDVRVLTESTSFKGVGLAKTGGQHGTDDTLKAIPKLGQVCGIVFSQVPLKTLYIAGDTIWNHHVEDAIARHRPDAIVLNAGKATFEGLPPIIMGEEDMLAVHKAAPNATLIASHMEAVNHCILSRADLRSYADKQGFGAKLLIPGDGASLTI